MISRLTLMLLAALGIALAPAAPADAADFRWQDAAGRAHSLDEWQGRPLILHLWASWCPPCRKEMPQLAAWLRRHPDTPMLVVSLDGEAKNARDFLDAHGIENVPVLLTDSGSALRLGARGLPSTILIRADGSVARILTGDQDWTDDSPVIRRLVEAAKPPR